VFSCSTAGITEGKRLLVFDDLYRSGATAGGITKLLLQKGGIGGLFVNLDADAEETMTSVFIGGSRMVSQLNSVDP
jgi:hypothetical protein